MGWTSKLCGNWVRSLITLHLLTYNTVTLGVCVVIVRVALVWLFDVVSSTLDSGFGLGCTGEIYFQMLEETGIPEGGEPTRLELELLSEPVRS